MRQTIELERPSAAGAMAAASKSPAENSAAGLVFGSAARLEHKLGEILHEFLMTDAATDQLVQGPHGSLPARALACRSLALIDDDEFADCMSIGKICDEFHRSPHASFASGTVASMCGRLRLRTRHQDASGPGAREQFDSAISSLLSKLVNRAFYIGGEKRTQRSWQT